MELKALSLSAIKASLAEFLTCYPALDSNSPTRVYVGLSGGLDSSVLLHALYRHIGSDLITAIHVNHGLQEDAAHFQAQAQTLCDSLSVRLHIEQVEVGTGASLEDQARQARFEAFARILPENGRIFLAHHLDDQIETFFLRLFRGSGLTGLTGMKSIQPFAHFFLARPLLKLNKQNLKEYALEHQLSWAEDHTNEDIRFKRNHLRQAILPDLLSRYEVQTDNIGRSIEQLNVDYQCLQSLLEPHLKRCLESANYPQTQSPCLNLNALGELTASVQALVIRQWVSQLGLYPPNQKQIDEIQASLINAKADAQPIYDYQNGQIRRHQNKLYWIKAFCQPSTVSLDLTAQEACSVAWANANVHAKPSGTIRSGYYQLCAASLVCESQMHVHKRGRKHFKQLFQEAKIPPWLRASWPVLLENTQPVALVGVAIAQSVFSEKGWSVSYDKSIN